ARLRRRADGPRESLVTADPAATSSAPTPLLRVAANRDQPPHIPAGPNLTASVSVRSFRVRRAVALLAAFRGLRRDQLEALLFLGEPLASRRCATHRVVADLRRRGQLEECAAVAIAARSWRAYALTAAGEGAYGRIDATYPTRRSRRPASVVRLAHATLLADIAPALARAAQVPGDIDLLWESDWQ